MKVRMIPDEVLNPFEEMVDELALKAYRVEKEKRTRSSTFQFIPAKMVLKLSRATQPGTLLAEVSMEDQNLNSVSVARTLGAGIDLIDYMARSVAMNRGEINLVDIRPMSVSEWQRVSSSPPMNP